MLTLSVPVEKGGFYESYRRYFNGGTIRIRKNNLLSFLFLCRLYGDQYTGDRAIHLESERMNHLSKRPQKTVGQIVHRI